MTITRFQSYSPSCLSSSTSSAAPSSSKCGRAGLSWIGTLTSWSSPSYLSSSSWPFLDRPLTPTIIAAIIISIIITFPGQIPHHHHYHSSSMIATWQLPLSAYFCFITLTTIGFGDLTPDQKMEDGEKRIALCSLYLLFGIAMIAMSFNLVQEEVTIDVHQDNNNDYL